MVGGSLIPSRFIGWAKLAHTKPAHPKVATPAQRLKAKAQIHSSRRKSLRSPAASAGRNEAGISGPSYGSEGWARARVGMMV
jgi:hypothetical protein